MSTAVMTGAKNWIPIDTFNDALKYLANGVVVQIYHSAGAFGGSLTYSVSSDPTRTSTGGQTLSCRVTHIPTQTVCEAADYKILYREVAEDPSSAPTLVVKPLWEHVGLRFFLQDMSGAGVTYPTCNRLRVVQCS
jgi:hypothetical protein